MKRLTKLTAAVVCSLSATGALADNGLGGDETTTDRVINGTAWTVLVSEPIALASEGTSCIATGSADARNPNVGPNRLYQFTLSIDNPAPALHSAFERAVEFDANQVGKEEVSSTATFRLLQAGVHTIYWLARKDTAATPNLTVTDNSMSFVCLNNLMDLDGLGDGNPQD
jgi:hypothetical protein